RKVVPQPLHEGIEPSRVGGVIRLPGTPAAQECVSEEAIGEGKLFDPREVRREVERQEILQYASRDRVPQILLGVPTPSADDPPDGLGIGLDVPTDADDRLPPGVFTGLDGHAGEQRVGLTDRVLDAHVPPPTPAPRSRRPAPKAPVRISERLAEVD